ncbi:hypothetical protein ScPMuIL_014905 [Solemya velum]
MPDTDGHVEAGSVKKNTENRDRSNDGFDSVEFDTPLPSEETKETFSFRKLPSYQKITLVCLVSMEFCAAASFSLLAPFFPAEANKKGVSDTIVGTIFGSFQLVIFLSSPIFGNYLSRIGPKFTFITGLMVCGTCSILFGTLYRSPDGVPFIVMCFLSRGVEALGAAAYITASYAIAAHEFPDHMATVFGILETLNSLGFMVGPPLGGALYEVGGYGLPFFVVGSTVIVVALVCIKVMPSQSHDHQPRSNSSLVLMKSPLALVTGFTIMCSALGLCFLEPTLANHLSQFKLRTIVIGFIFLISPGSYAVLAYFWGRIGEKWGHVNSMMLIGNILTAITYLFMGPSPLLLSFIPTKLWIITLSLFAMGTFAGCALIATFPALLNGAKLAGLEDNFDTFGIVSGFFNSCYALGAFLGPTALGGVLADKYGFGWAATGCAVFFGISGLLVALYCAIGSKCRTTVTGRPGYGSMDDGLGDSLTSSLRSQRDVWSADHDVAHTLYDTLFGHSHTREPSHAEK